jgi:hypothetical protein
MTIAISILIGLVVAVGLAWFSVWGRQPVAQEPLTGRMLDAVLDALLYRGVANRSLKASEFGQLAIWVRDDPRVFVLAKVWTDSGGGIRGELPRVAWAEPYAEPLRRELEARGIRFVAGEGADAPLLAIDFGRDLRLARSVVDLLFERVFGVHLASQCVGYFNEHVLPTEVPRLTGVRRGP